MSFVDLHLHTRYSDGLWLPDELCAAARKLSLDAIAVADHDTLDAVPEMLAAGKKHGIEVIPAVEITCRIDVREIHMLAYLPGETWKNRELNAVLDHSKHVREKRVGDMVARINELGVELTTEEVFACSDCGTVGRPHVAQALVKRGVVRTSDEAFDRFLKRGKPGFVDRYRMLAAEAIGHIHRAGGVASLAHPGLNRVDETMPVLVQQGLDGLEIWHSRHSHSMTEHYRKMAREHGLIVTGGSDCHGKIRGTALLGTQPVPYECVEAIRTRANA